MYSILQTKEARETLQLIENPKEQIITSEWWDAYEDLIEMYDEYLVNN